ncbi:MAG: hypothetical protein GY937_01985 [bacterium]|nr:hypothetical protein [bacterium]
MTTEANGSVRKPAIVTAVEDGAVVAQNTTAQHGRLSRVPIENHSICVPNAGAAPPPKGR